MKNSVFRNFYQKYSILHGKTSKYWSFRTFYTRTNQWKTQFFAISTRKTSILEHSTRGSSRNTAKLQYLWQNIEVLGTSTHEQISEKLSFSLFLPERLQILEHSTRGSSRNTAKLQYLWQNIEVLGPSTHEQISEKLSFSQFLPEIQHFLPNFSICGKILKFYSIFYRLQRLQARDSRDCTVYTVFFNIFCKFHRKCTS